MSTAKPIKEPQKTIEEIVIDWMNEAGIKRFNETVAIHRCRKKLFIVTRSPGVFIGWQGRLFDKYTKIFKENGYKVSVEFVDVFCGGVKRF